MKCPKCGYVSFDHLQNCKKCGEDLTVHKARFKVGAPPMRRPPVSPAPVTETVASQAAAPAAGAELPAKASEGEESAASVPVDEGLQLSKPAATIATLDTFLEESAADSLLTAEFDHATDSGNLPATPVDDFGFSIPSQPESVPLPAENEKKAEDQDLDLPSTVSAAEEPMAAKPLEFSFEQPEEPQFTFTFGETATAEGSDGAVAPGEGENLIPERPSLFDFPEHNASSADALTERPEAAEASIAFPVGEESLPDRLPDFERIDSALGGLPPLRIADPLLINGEYPRALEGNFAVPEECAPEETPSTELAAMSTEAEGESFPAGEASPVEALPAASLWRRFAAGLADGIILASLFLLFVLTAEAAIGGTRPIVESFLDLAIPYFLVFFCLSFGYFTLFHFLLGQTLGKLLFQLQVAGNGGESLLLSQAFLRSTGGLLALLPAGLGFLVIPFDQQGRGWNDRLAGTRVFPAGQRSVVKEMSESQVEAEG